MKNIQLPKDIVKYVKKKIIGYVALFVLLECAAIVINVLTWEYFAARTPLPFHIGVIVWICIVPFIILKFPFKLIDRSWRGEIVEISVEEIKINLQNKELRHQTRFLIYPELSFQFWKRKNAIFRDGRQLLAVLAVYIL